MVTPFDQAGDLDLLAARHLAAHLVDEMGNDSLVINGTTGEAPTTTVPEKNALVAAVKAEIGDRAKVLAGVGTFDTRHSVGLAKQARDAGADGLLVVTPYYSLPPQDGLLAHFLAVADATDLPNVIYDIPHRTGRPVEQATMLALAEHPNIVAVKDAKKDIASSAQVIAETELEYYAGDDAMVLPMLAIGGVGVVGTSTHFTGRRTKQLIQAWLDGDAALALSIFQELLPVYTGVFATQGCMMVKAGLAHQGMPVGGLRLPLPSASEQQAATFAALLDACPL